MNRREEKREKKGNGNGNGIGGLKRWLKLKYFLALRGSFFCQHLRYSKYLKYLGLGGRIFKVGRSYSTVSCASRDLR